VENPLAHFHLDDGEAPVFPGELKTVRLYKKEDRVWELQGFGCGPYFTDGATGNIIFANDVSLPICGELQGIGRYPDSVPKIRIPTLHRFVEALILLSLQPGPYTTWWLSELAYVVSRVDMELLGHDFRQFLENMQNPLVNLKTLLRIGRNALGDRVRRELL
jgi:hypothetical protein